MLRTPLLGIILFIGLVTGFYASAAEKDEKTGLPLLYENTFDDNIEDFVFTDPSAWEHVEEEGDGKLALTGSSDYAPPVRSPRNIARIEGLNVTDFVVEADMRQTGREYGHRDMCVFFGYQDPSHFYYVHMATKADDHANSIFLVNDAPRVSIAKERTDGTHWGSEVHRVRIERDSAKGTIHVYFDDMDTPIMFTEDKHFTWGEIGFGSFDDVGVVDNVRVYGKKHAADSTEAKRAKGKKEGSGKK